MTAPALTRPPRVTTACLFVGMSCMMLLFYVGSTLANWGSLDVQKQLGNFPTSETFKAAGLNETEALDALRLFFMSLAAVAVAGIFFAIYTALGHQASRIILTVMCGLSSLVFLAFGLFGILPAAFSIGCGIYLWTPDARQWFAVKNGRALPASAFATPRADPFATPFIPEGFDTPAAPATQPAVAAGPQPTMQVPPYRTRRPNTVLGAGLTAIIMSSLVAFVCGVNALAYLVARNDYVRTLSGNALMQETVRQIGMSPSDLARVLFIGCSIATVFALAAVAAAGATLAGKRTGRTLLVILAMFTLPVSIAAFPFGLLWTAGAIVTLVLLKSPESRSWFTRS